MPLGDCTACDQSLCSQSALIADTQRHTLSSRKCYVQVCQAISRAKKEEIVADLRSHLTNSSLVYGWKYENVAVRTSIFCVFCKS